MPRTVALLLAWSLVCSGAALLVTPLPGVLLVVAGLAILGTEYRWARRLLHRLTRQARRVAAPFASPNERECPTGRTEASATRRPGGAGHEVD